MSEIYKIYKLDEENARLPVANENAEIAILECNNMDKCNDWADKSQALALNGKQQFI